MCKVLISRQRYERTFPYIADPAHLPLWTNAFATVTNGRAMLRTPNGELEIGLMVKSSAEQGTVDWLMTFPDGSVATAYSLVMRLDAQYCVYNHPDADDCRDCE